MGAPLYRPASRQVSLFCGNEVYTVSTASVLSPGDVVHMINDIGIIRSGVDEVEELLQQCGDDLCLLVLPRDNDDLQFVSSSLAWPSS